MNAYCVPFAVPTWDFETAMTRLHEALHFGICPMLETVVDMLGELGNPDLAFDSLQVGGTNGKTSTSRYAAAILAGEGRRVALYTSPELVSYVERMEIDGRPVDAAAFAHGIAAASVAGERVNERRRASGQRPYDVTEFDLLTVAACVIFAEAGVDVSVLEVGLGGRWDATSAVKSICAVAVTGIGLDHTHILGNSLEAIASEKAAIIRRGRSCVLGVGTAAPASVEAILLDRCADEGVVPTLVRASRAEDAEVVGAYGGEGGSKGVPRATYAIERRPDRIGAPVELTVTTKRACYGKLAALKPAYQAPNIACAVTLVEGYLGRELNKETLYVSIACCPTPGRFDLVRPDPPALVDACHNPQSVRTFLNAVRDIEPDVAARPTLLAAVLADKDVDGIVSELSAAFPHVLVTQTSSPRALPAEALAAAFSSAGAQVEGAYPCVADALDALADDAFVACGSITLAGEVAGILRC